MIINAECSCSMSDKQYREEICVDNLKLFTKRKTLRALIGVKETEE